MVKVGDHVKIIQDNYEGVDLDSIKAYDLKVGDKGCVVERIEDGDYIVEFRIGDSEKLTQVIMEWDELEVIEDEE